MQRITEKQLDNLAEWINTLTNSPQNPKTPKPHKRILVLNIKLIPVLSLVIEGTQRLFLQLLSPALRVCLLDLRGTGLTLLEPLHHLHVLEDIPIEVFLVILHPPSQSLRVARVQVREA
jgi:hypothetical protein